MPSDAAKNAASVGRTRIRSPGDEFGRDARAGLAAADPGRALGAALLLGANIVCVNLAGQLIFPLRNVRPRTWIEKRAAQQSVTLSLTIRVICLLALAAFFGLRDAST